MIAGRHEPEQVTYIRLLDDMRGQVRAVLLGLYGEALNWHPLATGTNSIYALALHVAWVEDWWIASIVGGYPFEHVWDNDEDFLASGEDPADLLVYLDEAAARTAAVFAGIHANDWGTLRTTTRSSDQSVTISVRECVVHTIEHYSEHLGQMRLTQQLWLARR